MNVRIIMLGPPGSGKGTISEYLSKKHKFQHISTGEIFRQNIREKSSLGKIASEFINKGALVPDEIVINMVKNHLEYIPKNSGFILDGFPRTVEQAVALNDILHDIDAPLSAVLNILTSEQIIIDRLSGRRHCSKCGKGFNVIYMPPKIDGVCDACGAQLVQRHDDRHETVVKRINTYNKQTKPLIEFYNTQDLLFEIRNDGAIELAQKEAERVIHTL